MSDEEIIKALVESFLRLNEGYAEIGKKISADKPEKPIATIFYPQFPKTD